MVMSKGVLVVGAGISGATIANLIAVRTGTEVTVIDRRQDIGGNCRDYRDENGIMIHEYGSHIFHTDDQEVWRYLGQFASFNQYMHHVRAVIDGIETEIPFSITSLYDVFPESLAHKLEEKLLSNFEYNTRVPVMDLMKKEDEDLKFLASFIYEKVFLHYTEKQWGLPPDRIDGAVTSRVPVVVGKDPRYFRDKYQGIPLEGYNAMIERMLSVPNITVKLNTDFKDVEDPGQYSHIFYTGSVDEISGSDSGFLPYRSIRLEFEQHDTEHYLSNAVINYPNNYDFTRIHEFKYYLNDVSDKTVIAKEYPEEFFPELNEMFYPIASEENEKLHTIHSEAVRKKYPNLTVLGRLGDYKYYDMDKAVRRAMDVFKAEFK
jgi:UDP-galactopyranose mutase